jgi:hypothetical protein
MLPLAAGRVLLAVDESKVTPGIAGFLVVFALGVATWLLIRSMTRHLRKVDFDESTTEGGRTGSATGEAGEEAGPDQAPAPGPTGDQPLR